MNRFIYITVFCLLITTTAIVCKPAYQLLDKDVPGTVPRLFAADIVGAQKQYAGYCAFSADGKELYYAVTNNRWEISKMVFIPLANSFKPDTIFLKDHQYEGEPFITADNQTMYFTVVLPPDSGKIWQADIYRSFRTSNGWSVAEKLDTIINSDASEWHVSFAKNNMMYFTSERENGTSALHGDIFKAKLDGTKFQHVTKLPNGINTQYNDSDPLIAPDESYLIFHSDRPGGYGEHDLYIAFFSNGNWSDPKNMGNLINTPAWEMAPSLTPDGKYLLFTRRKAMITDEPSQIWWVSTKILKHYK